MIIAGVREGEGKDYIFYPMCGGYIHPQGWFMECANGRRNRVWNTAVLQVQDIPTVFCSQIQNTYISSMSDREQIRIVSKNCQVVRANDEQYKV